MQTKADWAIAPLSKLKHTAEYFKRGKEMGKNRYKHGGREGGKPQETIKYREQTKSGWGCGEERKWVMGDRKSTRLNSSH